MKTKIFIILLFSVTTTTITAQINHVQNYSFEHDTGNCFGFGFCNPYIASRVPPWYSPTGGSPDWFNPTCGGPNFGVPQNYAGYQYARSGISYAGISFVQPSSLREYITGTLTDSIK